jgi:hypothetical protein
VIPVLGIATSDGNKEIILFLPSYLIANVVTSSYMLVYIMGLNEDLADY